MDYSQQADQLIFTVGPGILNEDVYQLLNLVDVQGNVSYYIPTWVEKDQYTWNQEVFINKMSEYSLMHWSGNTTGLQVKTEMWETLATADVIIAGDLYYLNLT